MIYYKPMENNAQRYKKPFREWLLNICGYEIWPPTHNDPRIQGPQPRIISKRQADALRAFAEANKNEGFPNSVKEQRECGFDVITFDDQGHHVL